MKKKMKNKRTKIQKLICPVGYTYSQQQSLQSNSLLKEN